MMELKRWIGILLVTAGHLQAVTSKPKHVPKPEIDVWSISNVVFGTRAVFFKCRVTVENSKFRWYHMDWKIPKPEQMLTGRINETQAKREKDSPPTEVRGTAASQLIITNVTLEDQGDYECTITDRRNNNTNSDKASLQVYGPSDKLIFFDVQGSEEIAVKVKEPYVKWVVQVKQRVPHELRWYDPQGTEIPVNSDKYVIASNRTTTSLKIRNIVESDAGIYQLKASANENEEIENVTLYVHAKPTAALVMDEEPKKLHYTYKENITIRCEATGYPNPNITWYFKSCKDLICDVNNTAIEDFTHSQHFDNLYVENDGINSSTLQMDILESGYLTCLSCNIVGCEESTTALFLKEKVGAVLTIGIAVGAAFFCLITVFLVIHYQRERKLRQALEIIGLANFQKGELEKYDPDLGIEDQAELLPYDKKWEFPRHRLILGKQIGSGAFGMVMKAEAHGIVEWEATTTVAVKMVKRCTDSTHIKALASELKIMAHLGSHLNVVNLLGACTKNLAKQELFVIVEYCYFGNLQEYIKQHRENFIDQIDPATGKVDFRRSKETKLQNVGSYPVRQATGTEDHWSMPGAEINGPSCNDVAGKMLNTADCLIPQDLTVSNGSGAQYNWRTNLRGDFVGSEVPPVCTSDLICWAFQIARGMDYLASRKVLHGDLAARNILLAEDNIVKICDFGLAKTMHQTNNYQKRGDGPLPIKWLAIECLRDKTFSTQSDVWSYGIVLWEFFSLGQNPYPGMVVDERLYDKLLAGYRMKKPRYATHEIYAIMRDCWRAEPRERPMFLQLEAIFCGMLDETTKSHYANINFSQSNARSQEAPTPYLGEKKAPTYENARKKPTNQTGCTDWPTCPVVGNHREPVTIGNHVWPSKGEELSDSEGRVRSTPLNFFTRKPADPVNTASFMPMSKLQNEPIQTDVTKVREAKMEPPQESAQLSPRKVFGPLPESESTAAEPLLQHQRGAPQRLDSLNWGLQSFHSNPTYASQALVR
ncbi:vascular endothelial growth factor receptor 2-like [Ischnura elegans]|uniref:vascular endothelial growth factor receptor 2-like n=1 Tax=Ischnura elegans TaxID=197161 RepID=UPI001ED8A67B|nr:vascular endothelial growth factor receptor 2-like [Ischnura elegans]